MRIGLIAMSGVRAWSEELNRAGLTMPGVMERGAVIASLPSLSLLTLAGMTGPEHEVSYHEIRDLRDHLPLCRRGGEHPLPGPGPLPSPGRSLPLASEAAGAGGLNLVAISTMTAQVKDAYAVADWYRGRGVKVVMGGLHVTALPEEALGHCDAVVVGEAEPVWERLLADAERGALRRVYRRSEEEPDFDLAAAPMPRFELLDIHRYNRLTVQTTRGCPHACDFCASSITLTKKYKVKPVDRVMAELERIRSVWPEGERPFIEFADDNSFASRGAAKKLLTAMAAERGAGRGVSWFTEVDLSIAWEPELLELMRESGCRQVLIGLESPVEEGLDGLETRRNWKLKQHCRYEEAVRLIQSRGITVNGCFILGLDGQIPDVFDRVAEFAERTSLFDVQITVLTPFPGTPLYARLEREGRLIEPGAWEKCTLFDVNFVPGGMTVRELEEGFLKLAARLYHPDAVKARREGYFKGVTKEARQRA
ncbi:MAG TPA: radical SAM protein [Phycisphaerales bacterium]|nr:radical SAM protein [Phycisphaerales bacterium]